MPPGGVPPKTNVQLDAETEQEMRKIREERMAVQADQKAKQQALLAAARAKAKTRK
jgi:hypothetical protein